MLSSLIFSFKVSSQHVIPKLKSEVIATIVNYEDSLIYLSDQVWAYAETALLEYRSSALLAEFAERQGFEVKIGIAGMPTAFTAEFGSGKPIIGILGEYDALPGISQKALPTKEPL